MEDPKHKGMVKLPLDAFRNAVSNGEKTKIADRLFGKERPKDSDRDRDSGRSGRRR